MKGKKTLGVIIARKGSKRLPGKNMKILKGIPLIEHTIISAMNSKLLSDIALSTNDSKIIKFVKKYYPEIMLVKRPESLCEDDTPAIAVLNHVNKFFKGYGYGVIVLLQPTSPLRTSDDIDNTIKALLEENADSAETLTPVVQHPAYMMRIVDGCAKPIQPKNFHKRSQEQEELFIENGAVYAIMKETLEKGGIFGKKHVFHIMPFERSIDIDTIEDFKIAEALKE